jgi:uncharacterized peroxidase-related enzyme
MPWIRTLREDDADGALRDAYEQIEQARGKLSNIMRVQSLNPAAMQAHLKLYQTLLFGHSRLSRAERELIGTVVSSVNGCAYCTRHHAEALRAYWSDEERVEQVIDDWRSADLSDRKRALLRYAVKLTEAPSSMTKSDVAALRTDDLSDEDVLSVNLITSYFNFVNRITEGLGVTATEEEASGYEY